MTISQTTIRNGHPHDLKLTHHSLITTFIQDGSKLHKEDMASGHSRYLETIPWYSVNASFYSVSFYMNFALSSTFIYCDKTPCAKPVLSTQVITI